MTGARKAVMDEGWTLSSGGTIQDPGKFEGEHWSTICLWDRAMDGEGDSIFDEFEVLLTAIHLSEDERREYELPDDAEVVVLWETEQGFVEMQTWTEWEWNAILNDIEDVLG